MHIIHHHSHIFRFSTSTSTSEKLLLKSCMCFIQRIVIHRIRRACSGTWPLSWRATESTSGPMRQMTPNLEATRQPLPPAAATAAAEAVGGAVACVILFVLEEDAIDDAPAARVRGAEAPGKAVMVELAGSSSSLSSPSHRSPRTVLGTVFFLDQWVPSSMAYERNGTANYNS